MVEQKISLLTYNLIKEKGIKLTRCVCGGYPECICTESTNKPTQSLLQKHLRETYDIHINITKVYDCSKSPAIFEGWCIHIAGKTFETNYTINDMLISKSFESYEDALEVGLQESVLLIKS